MILAKEDEEERRGKMTNEIEAKEVKETKR